LPCTVISTSSPSSSSSSHFNVLHSFRIFFGTYICLSKMFQQPVLLSSALCLFLLFCLLLYHLLILFISFSYTTLSPTLFPSSHSLLLLPPRNLALSLPLLYQVTAHVMRNSRFEGDRRGRKKGKEEFLQHTISLNLANRDENGIQFS
jgi:hypothetical protein